MIDVKDSLVKSFLKSYRNLSLKRKLTLLFYIQVIIPIVFIGYLSYSNAARAIKNKSFEYSQDILKMIEMRLKTFYTETDNLSRQLLYDNRIYDYLNEKNLYANDDQYNNIRTVFRDAVLSREGIEGIMLLKDKSQFVSFSNKAGFNADDIVPYDFLYNSALKRKGNMCWFVYPLCRSFDDYIYGARVINSRETFEPIGLMVMVFKKKYIESMYSDLSIESYNSIAILSEDKETIVKSKDTEDRVLELIDNNKNKSQNYFVDDDSRSLISYVDIGEPQWRIIYCIPLKELYSEIRELKITIMLLVIVSIIVLSILSSFTAIDIVNPINKLVDAMKKLDNNGKHTNIEVKRNDEIGYLMRTFNTMAYNIDYLVNVNYKEKLTRKEAQIKALQSQINPHFIFNTLENVNWLAQLNGIDEISTTVTALANIMQASICRGSKLVTLEEELTYVDSYIDIFKVRFSDKFTIERNIAEDTLDIKIPKLLIEPIVENALNHGIERVSRQGILIINSFMKDGDFIIEVNDNGIGMKKDELADLMEKLNSDEDNVEGSIGLINVNKRIKLFYGEEYGLQIESEYDKFTKVTIRISRDYINREGEKSDV